MRRNDDDELSGRIHAQESHGSENCGEGIVGHDTTPTRRPGEGMWVSESRESSTQLRRGRVRWDEFISCRDSILTLSYLPWGRS